MPVVFACRLAFVSPSGFASPEAIFFVRGNKTAMTDTNNTLPITIHDVPRDGPFFAAKLRPSDVIWRQPFPDRHHQSADLYIPVREKGLRAAIIHPLLSILFGLQRQFWPSAAFYGILAPMLLRWFENSRVYHPSRHLEATGKELGGAFEDVSFKSSDGVELNGWFYPAASSSQFGDMAFLNCHGNGGNISHRLGLYRAMLETGPAVFSFDYRGYGRSRGKPGEEGTYLDAQAAYGFLRQKGFAPRNIIVYGESLGGGIASELCLRAETGGLILQSTFTSLPDIGAELYPYLPVRWMGRIKYDTRSKLPRIKVPVLVMHSREDDLIGYRHSEQNFAAANEPKFFAELSGGHNDPAWEAPEFEGALEKFLTCVREKNCGERSVVSGQ